MDVKAFIFEATDKAIKIDEAERGVDAAKEAVEAARAALEATKAGVDAAKQVVVAAKEELAGYAERAEEFGLTRSKFKDAVERMKTLLADIGAVETVSSDAADPAEAKPKITRKRKSAEASSVTLADAMEGAVKDEELVVIGEITDPASAALAEKAAEVGHVEWADVASPAVEVEPVIAETSDPEVVAAVEEVLEQGHVVTTTQPQAEEEDELDNSFAEQELTDYVAELGSTDKDVVAALEGAIKVVSWHATNVDRSELRTMPSPLTLSAVLAAEDVDYLPAEIKAAYAAATAHGGEKLGAAIAWFNKGIELLADGKSVTDFRFAEPAKAPRAAKPAFVAEPVSENTQDEDTELTEEEADIASAMYEVIGDVPADVGYTETIEDMEIFSPAEETEEPAAASVVEETAPVPVAEEPKPAAAAPKRPAWLK